MSFTFNTGIPAANNDPSVDQPDMLSNNVSTNAILAVDHVTFNTANGGTHKQTTFIGKNPPGAQVDPTAVLYTNDGVANATHPQLRYRNSQGIFPISALRAAAVFQLVAVNGAVIPTNAFNIASIVASGPPAGKIYTITLNANSVNSDDVIVSIDFSNINTGANYTFIGGVLTINTTNRFPGDLANFSILQF